MCIRMSAALCLCLCSFAHRWVRARLMPQVAECSVECVSLHLFSPQGGAVRGQLAERSREKGWDRLDKRWDVGTSRRHG